jgi:hypothetical protein
VLQCMCFLYGPHCLHQFKYQSKFLQQFRTLENYQSSTEELFICSDIVMKKVGTTHLSHRYQFAVTNDRTGPVGNVWVGGIVAYLSILEFDISSVRSFLCRGRLYNAMHFHNVSLGFFMTLFIGSKSCLTNRSQNAE